jgi:lysozyme family protein
MNDNFIPSLGFVLRHECVYAPGHDGDLDHVVCENVPGDTGGCTKFGIDAASHPGVDIRGLTLAQATAIYHEGEWAHCRCDDLPKRLDTAIFDCAVNNGLIVAGILLQRSIIACGHGVVVDGEIGLQTVRAAIASNGPELMERLLQLRRQRYTDIVLHHPGDAKFLKGWLARVDDLERFLFS